jgi:hypothetical protein
MFPQKILNSITPVVLVHTNAGLGVASANHGTFVPKIISTFYTCLSLLLSRLVLRFSYPLTVGTRLDRKLRYHCRGKRTKSECLSIKTELYARGESAHVMTIAIGW